MTDSPTSGLLIRKQTVATNANVWGDPYLNTNFDLIDAKLTAQSAISTTGGTTVLTSSNYTVTQSTSGFLRITGALVSNATIEIPARRNQFWVRNDTTGAFTVQVRVSGGVAVTITRTARVLVYCDGTDCFLMTPEYGSQGRIHNVTTPVDNTDAANKGYVDTYSADRSAAGFKLTNLGTPTAAGDAASKAYVDASANAFTWAFDTSTVDADPGAGLFRFNNATQNAATFIYIDATPSNGGDATAFLDTLAASSSFVKTNLTLRNIADSTQWLTANITGVTTATGYRKLAITVTASSSASPFGAAAVLSFGFARVGDAGSAGPPGGGNLAIARIDNAVGGETSITVAYDPPNVIVIKNGATLQPTEFTATSGTSVVLNVALVAGDTLQVLGLQGVALSGEVPSSRQIATQFSLTGGGDLTNNRLLNLVGDVASPGNNKVYGTNSGGTRGWYDLPATSGGATVTSTASSFALTAASNRLQAVTFTADSQSVTLPDATTITTLGGPIFVIANDGTRPFGVRANGGALLAVVGPGGVAECYLEANSTAAGSWSISGRELQPALTTCDTTLSSAYSGGTTPAAVRLTDTLSLHFARNASGHPFVFAIDHSTFPATVGTPVLIVASNLSIRTAVRLTNTKAAIVVSGASSNVYNVTVSGTTCTVSTSATAAVFDAQSFLDVPILATLGANNDLLVAIDTDGATTVRAQAVDCSGTNPSAGASANISALGTGTVGVFACYRIDNTTAIAFYMDNSGTAGTPFSIRAATLSLSGTTITVNTSAGINDVIDGILNATVCQLSPSSYIVTYYVASGTLVRGVVVTVSGTTVTFNTPITIETTDAANRIGIGAFYSTNRFSQPLTPITATTALFMYVGDGPASARSRHVVLTNSSGTLTAGSILYRLNDSGSGSSQVGILFPASSNGFCFASASDASSSQALVWGVSINGTSFTIDGALSRTDFSFSSGTNSYIALANGVHLVQPNANVTGFSRPGTINAFRRNTNAPPTFIGQISVPFQSNGPTAPLAVSASRVVYNASVQPQVGTSGNTLRFVALEFPA